MKYLNRLFAVASAAFFIAGSALAQNTGTVSNHAYAIGKGPGVTGYTSLLCGSAQLAVGQSAADPICQTITGDVTISAAGVTAIGATKVLNSMLATMAANTTKCNATAGTAVPTDCTAATMRTNIGVVIGTNVQAWDADLDCLAAISTNGIVARAGAGTCAVRTVTAPAAGITITNGDGVAGNPTLVLANDLGALEGLSGTGIARRTGTDAWSVGTAVANSELATAADGTIKSNISGATASPSDNTISAVLDKLGSTQGQVLYRNATTWVPLAPGSAGQFFTTQGAAANPNWSSGGAGTGTVTGVTAGTGLSASPNPITASGTITNTGVVTVKKQVFTASGTYTPSVGMIYAVIECWGGGGGGGSTLGASGTVLSSGGGGSGSKSIKYAIASDIGASKTVTIGAGGVGGVGGAANDGNAGGDTSVGTLCIGKGGAGGTRANGLGVLPDGGLGGVAGTGDIAGVGQPGGLGILYGGTGSHFPSGAGGSTELGAGGKAVSATATAFVAGLAGSGPGAGGGGASTNNATNGPAGGSGAAGFVRITEFCSQ